MNVYMVHSESGAYSDHEYDVRGIFSTYDGARQYIERQAVEVYRLRGTAYKCDFSKAFDVWTDTTDEDDLLWELNAHRTEHEVAETREIAPKSTDGATFSYAYPDGTRTGEHLDTFYITEYEVLT